MSLAYFHGKHAQQMTHLFMPRFKYDGYTYQLLSFWLRTFLSTRLRRRRLNKVDFLFYAGSLNQKNSLKPSYQQISKTSSSLFLLLDRKHKDQDHLYITLTYTIRNLLTALLLFSIRFPQLIRTLKKNNRVDSSYKYGLKQIIKAYIYLPSFLEMLASTQPRYVVVSNDHNVDTRSLRISAQILDIKTVYLQHASVSRLFPPLDFDIAFLDGEKSLEIYKECNKNTDYHSNKAINVFLSGQKKFLTPVQANSGHITRIGLATNLLDPLTPIIELARKLTKIGLRVVIRHHPSQSPVFTEGLKALQASTENIRISDPEISDINDFFQGVDVLIAGDSSIHLEAALAGLTTYYYHFSKNPEGYDYYGFLNEGICSLLPDDLTNFTQAVIHSEHESRKRRKAILRYSATYGTYWSNKEGQLVAETLELVEKGQSLLQIYKTQYTHDVGEIYSLGGCPEFCVTG